MDQRKHHHSSIRHILASLLAVTLVLAGCARRGPVAELAQIYNRAAQDNGPGRNPVIVIPGILGTKLVDQPTETVVWGAFAGKYANTETAQGAWLMALPMREGEELAELRDDVQPKGALDRLKVSLWGLPISLDAYVNILATLGVGGYRDQQLAWAGAIDYGTDHFTCFQFDYDWRRDNVENAKRLHQFILKKKAYVQDQMEKRYGQSNAEVKFDIVAHSMGGLISRYYLMYGDADLSQDGAQPVVTWSGAKHVERLVLIGTPNAGSLESLIQLLYGKEFAAALPRVPAVVLGTMPSIYQLLPRSRHKPIRDEADGQPLTDLYDPKLWEQMGWGLCNPNQAKVLEWLIPDEPNPVVRRRIALDHQRKCLLRAKRFTTSLDVPAPLPEGLELHLFVGDAEPTAERALVDRKSGNMWVVQRGPGDGTVLRSSAMMDERLDERWGAKLRSPIQWTQVHFLFTDHLGMTKDPMFADNVLYLLLEAPR